MYKNIIALLVVAFSLTATKAEIDTLRIYDPGNVFLNYYNSNTYPTQVARFDLQFPAIIKGFGMTLNGKAGSTVKMQFLGHEGGVALISLMNNLVSPITVTKPNDGKEMVYVQLDSPYVQLDNSQFFLVFSEFNGAQLITDRTDHPYSCKSTSGGDYFYQYGINSSGGYLLLSSQNRAFAIDIVLEYVETASKNILKDVTTEAGIDLTHSNATIAAADYNMDGFIDLMVSGILYKNNKDGSFTQVGSQLGIKNKYAGITANAFIDNDNDGDLDIFLFGGDTSVLLINNGGIFTEKILSLPSFKSFLSFSFADINNDHYPDLFVSQLWTAYPEPEPNYFFYNTGSNDFTDNTTVIYPEYDGTWNWPNRMWDPANYVVERNRNSRGSQWLDFDNDGDQDLYITNYFLQPDEFYRNNGDGSFTDICQAKGIDKNITGSNHGTGVDWYDYDNDGDLDLLLPQFAHPRFIGPYDHRGTAIYRNEGSPGYNFTDMIGQYNNYPGLKSTLGLELEETHAGGAWGDVNNDGLVDILLTVFYGCRYINFYEQQADHSFALKTFEYGLAGINTGTDLVWLDYDNDGRLDLACGIEGKFRLFKNDVYNSRRWVEIDLQGTSTNTYAIGARATVYAGGQEFMQEVCAGRGQKMQKPYRLHFGLGYTPVIDSVVVDWGTKNESFTGLNVNHIYTLAEGGSIALSAFEMHLIDPRIYPNPSNGEVKIEFELPYSSHVEIDVYNHMMQHVAKIADKNYNHHVQLFWDNSKMPAGIYFLKFGINGEERNMEMIIVQ